MNKESKESKECKQCNKTYIPLKRFYETQKFCSVGCGAKWQVEHRSANDRWAKAKATSLKKYGENHYRNIAMGAGRKRTLKDKECEHCSKIFRPGSNKSRFCSMPCAFKNRPKTGRFFRCFCGKDVWVRLSQMKFKNHYCSKKCFQEGSIISESRVELECNFCKDKYIRYRSSLNGRGSRFCTIKCVREYKKMKHYTTKKANSTDKAKLKKLLWGIFSQYIRQRDGGTCISCGKEDFWRNTDAGHYVPKTAGLSLYFDEVNVNCQCTYCNRWMHGNLSRYAIALRKKYGESVLEDIEAKRIQIRKITVSEYQELIEKYKVLLQGFN